MKNKEYSMAMNWNYIGISVVVLAILTTLVLYFPNMREVDSTVLRSIRLALSPFPSYIPAFVCSFGWAGHLLWPQITAACVLVSHRLFLKAFMLILFTQMAFYTKDLFKNFVCRPRPDDCGIHSFSFPSGHSCLAMCFFGIVIYLIHCYVRSDFWRNFLIILFGLWIFLVGISRMWLGTHFPSDVIAGMFLGFVFVNLFIIIDKSLSR
jgi:undecaprenyl-diphosphatase